MVISADTSTVVFPYLGEISFHGSTLKMSFIVMVFLSLLAFSMSRKILMRPSLKQSLFEWVVSGCYGLTEDALGHRAKNFFPFICTIFLFIFISNIMGIIPGLKSPTQDLNVCIGLALSVFFVSHFQGIKKRGICGYLKEYTKPFILMLPINVIGEMGQTVSHCFRLFGNIFGGSVIAALIPVIVFKTVAALGCPSLVDVGFFEMDFSQGLWYSIFLPLIGLIYFVVYAFFGLFSGFIQALVFTILATTYISMQTND